MFGFGFGGGGGMPRGGPRGPAKEVDTKKFYDVLGLSKEATKDDIKKAYRKLAIVHHPDKGGDTEKFKEISKAYETLSDDSKRKMYDQFGEEGLENGGGGGGGSEVDIFDLFTGGAGRRGGGGQSRQRRGEDVVYPLKVTLDELYNGCSKKLRLTKSVICPGCNGKGGKGDAVVTCKTCKGRGVKVVIRQLGPGMIQQMQMPCDDCDQSGQVIPEKDKCQQCEGNRTIKEKKTLEVHIERGMLQSQKIVFNGEGDEAPETIPGDVVVVLQQKEHDVFQRDGGNLFMKKSITLFEALCGFSFKVQHMNDDPARYMMIKSEPGVVYKPGDIKVIASEGMPTHKNPYVRGHLYIKFEVEFPKSHTFSEQQKQLLTSILPQPVAEVDQMKDEDDATIEEYMPADMDPSTDFSKTSGSDAHKNAYDEDDGSEHQHGPTCRSQ
jgi:DnaJ family protein A protein 2